MELLIVRPAEHEGTLLRGRMRRDLHFPTRRGLLPTLRLRGKEALMRRVAIYAREDPGIHTQARLDTQIAVVVAFVRRNRWWHVGK